MKKGFTLAEVLITLAIIGVVAALTIPTVMANYNKKAQYTSFMKMYNTITNTLALAESENGTPNSWTYNSSEPYATAEKYIYPYLKIAGKCDSSDNSNVCSIPYDFKSISGEDFSDLFQQFSKWVLLQDGTMISLYATGGNALTNFIILFDTNGKKGPNIIGRDFFVLNYSYNGLKNEWGFLTTGDLGPENCDPNSSSSDGSGCAAKLIQEGKMSY